MRFSIRTKNFRTDALVLAIGGHWTILVGVGLARLQVEDYRTSEIKYGRSNSDIAGKLRNTASDVFSESGPELTEEINTRDVDMGSEKQRNQSKVFVE